MKNIYVIIVLVFLERRVWFLVDLNWLIGDGIFFLEVRLNYGG